MRTMAANLYSFIIVDDEPEIREGIRDTIPWEQLGFRFAGACANGAEALELAEREPPDVLMTDINMPFMDGLALSERLADLAPATKVLIISGYDDFEYARQAVKLQVYDYIVKPVTPVEFKAVLVRLKETIDKERAVRQDLERIKRRLAETLPELRERFLNNLILGKVRKESLSERIDYFGLPLPLDDDAYQCVVLDFTRRAPGPAFDIDLITLRGLIELFMNDGGQGLLFQDAEDRLTLLLWGRGLDDVYRESLKTVEHLRHYLSGAGIDGLVLGIGEPVAAPEALSRSYRDAVRAVQVAVLRGRSGIIAYRELAGSSGAERPTPAPWGKRIASALKLSSLEEAYRQIDGMIDAFRASPFTIESYHAALRLVLAAILQSLEDLEIPQLELFPADEDPFAALGRQKSLDEVRSFFASLVESVIACTGARQENFARVKVREALELLESRYTDPDLALQSICKDLYISTSYFSAILKKYHDKTFVEQLTEIRLRKAMELLRSTSLKTYDIALRVGYRDAHYFSLSFRKFAGCTPTEFRGGTVQE